MSFMNLFRGLGSSARPKAKPRELTRFRIKGDWKPAAKMERVIVHWTGGAYVASSHDKACYHFLVQGDLSVVRGQHPITANVHIGSKSSDDYAAHTRACNTRSIGVSICCMAGGVEVPFSAGKYPLTEAQWQRAAEVIADLCRTYDIPVTPKTVLTHAEVQTTLGIWQRAKWDMNRLAFNLNLKGHKTCGDDLRRRVLELMK